MDAYGISAPAGVNQAIGQRCDTPGIIADCRPAYNQRPIRDGWGRGLAGHQSGQERAAARLCAAPGSTGLRSTAGQAAGRGLRVPAPCDGRDGRALSAPLLAPQHSPGTFLEFSVDNLLSPRLLALCGSRPSLQLTPQEWMIAKLASPSGFASVLCPACRASCQLKVLP